MGADPPLAKDQSTGESTVGDLSHSFKVDSTNIKNG
jgi:hypothetical protein